MMKNYKLILSLVVTVLSLALSVVNSPQAFAVYYTRDEIRATVPKNTSEKEIDDLYSSQMSYEQLKALSLASGLTEADARETFDKQDVLSEYKFLKCNNRFLGFPAWYRGLTDGNCDIKTPDQTGLSRFIWHIVMNVIEAAMVLVGYIAVGFILYGGFLYITSQGEAANITKAKTSITNAVIGLIISILAIAIINFIYAGITKQ